MELKRAQGLYYELLIDRTIRKLEEGKSRKPKMGNQRRD
jgi:hypothetical protein